MVVPSDSRVTSASGVSLCSCVAQQVHGLSDLLEAHAGIEQALHDPELDDVAKGVEPLRARTLGAGQRRAKQVGARPVVELPVGDAHDLAHLRSAISRFDRHDASSHPQSLHGGNSRTVELRS